MKRSLFCRLGIHCWTESVVRVFSGVSGELLYATTRKCRCCGAGQMTSVPQSVVGNFDAV